MYDFARRVIYIYRKRNDLRNQFSTEMNKLLEAQTTLNLFLNVLYLVDDVLQLQMFAVHARPLLKI